MVSRGAISQTSHLSAGTSRHVSIGRSRYGPMLQLIKRSIAVLATAAAVAVAAPAHSAPTATACRVGYYKNVSGHCVHRPSSNPRGATARCRDGTYSYSEHASGTCSHHGGVSRWINHP